MRHGQGKGFADHDGKERSAKEHAVEQVGLCGGTQLFPEDHRQHRKGQTKPHRQQVQRADTGKTDLGKQQGGTSGKDDSGQQPLSTFSAHDGSLRSGNFLD